MTKLLTLLFALFGAACAAPGLALGYDHPGGLHSKAQIAFTRAQLAAGRQPWQGAWRQLLERADAGLRETPSAVVHFTVPDYYDDPVGHGKAKDALLLDAEAAYTTALVYALMEPDHPDRIRFAAKAVELINAWAYTNTSYARSNDARLVLPYTGTAFVFAAELISDFEGWGAADREQFRTWVRNVLRNAAHLIKSKPNNWADWGIMSAVACDHYLDDESAMADDVARLKELIDKQIAGDGRLPEELLRGERSLHYTHFALEPMTAAVEIVRNFGGTNLYDWKPASGGTIRQALQFLFDNGIENPERWPGAAQLLTPSPTGMASETFQAMGLVYGVQKWLDWVAQPVYRNGTGLAFIAPTLMQPAPLNGAIPVPPAAPKGLRLAVSP